ncbi:MAG: peptidylprolyl isomerase [Phycisphaerae bacterium]
MNARLFPAFACLALAATAYAQEPANTLASPAPASIIAPPAPSADDTPNNALSPVRANVGITTNALLGFVNAEPVFANDLFRPIDGELRSLASNCRDLSEFRSQARAAIQRQIQAHVQETLVISAAKASLTDQEKKGLDVYMATERSKLLSKYGGSLALADEALRAEGTSVEKTLDDERTTMIVRIYMHRELYPKIVVTRQMVLDEYERTKHTEDEEIELFTITLRVSRWLREPGENGKLGPINPNPSPAQIAQAEHMALKQGEDIVDQLRHGADFARLVEDNSQDDRANYGGRMPNVKRGSLKPVLEKAAFALPANTVGEPLLIKDPDFRRETVVILKVGQKKEARTIPFSEAQKDIYAALERKQYAELANEYTQKLYRQGAVEAVERMTNVAVDVAVARYATE